MYTVIGSDQQEYGPVSAEEIKRWILEGRVNGQTLAKSEATGEWKTLGEYPEFADTFKQMYQPPFPPQAEETFDLNRWQREISGRDYYLSVTNCISMAFNLYKNNFGFLFGSCFIYFLIIIAFDLLATIPVIGIPFILALIILLPVMTGGLYYIFISKVRGRYVDIGGLFYSFKHNLIQLILLTVVQGLLMCVIALPGGIIAGLSMTGAIVAKASALAIVGIIVGTLVSSLMLIYYGICWFFPIPLVVDKGIDFWTALKISKQKVKQHWFSVLWLAIMIGLINIAGALFCGIGIFLTFPLSIGTYIYAYETIFRQ